ncbi:MAG: tetratricopeptide repeat protein [Calditrichaeota bacterium]|nr:tetratricopeptide repeat protein [Calditrichota bacterium]MCB0313575.1 tetratricopeptide repeat protein [Calditrichota bacterium]MCB9090602.1 tetratricopeptide repeat protein [Calditrichia bacterium]
MKLFSNIILRIVFLILLMMGSSVLFAQEEMEDEDSMAMETADCKPASLESPYDKYQSDTLEIKQIQIWYSFGQEEYKHKQFVRALPYYWKVLVNDKTGTYKVTYSKIATCYMELGKEQPENSKAYFDSTMLVVYRGLELYPDNSTLHYRAGSLQRSRGSFECAIPHYEALVAENPKEESYMYILADLLFKVEDERCIEVQQKLIDLAPDNLDYRNTMVNMVTFFGGDPLDVLRKAFESDTTNIANAVKYGREALVTGNYAAALRAFKAVVAQDPQHIEAMDQMAKSYEGLNRNSEAISTFKRILDIDPNNIDVLCSLARAYIDQNSFSTARSYALKARSINSGDGQPYLVLGEVYTRAAEHCSNKRPGDKGYTYDDKLVFEKAAEMYRQAEKDPNFASTANNRRQSLAPFFRTKEDKFMIKRETITDDCYSWIQ